MKSKKVLLVGSVVAFVSITSVTLYYNNSAQAKTKEVFKEKKYLPKQNKVEGTSLDKNITVVKVFPKRESNNSNEVNSSLNKAIDDSNEESIYMKHILDIKKPTEKDFAILEKDARYGEEGFEAGLRTMIKDRLGDVSSEVINKIIKSAKSSAYRHDVLINQYANGEITKEFLLKAINTNMKLTDAEHREFLTEEQYEKYVGEYNADETEIDMEAYREKEFFSAFPNIKQNNPNIKVLEDLYEYVPVDVVEKLIEIDDNNMKLSLRLDAKFNRGEISGSEVIEQLNKSKKNSEMAIRQLLTPEQQKLFFDEPKVEVEHEQEELDEETVDAMLTPEQQEILERNGSVFVPTE